MFQRSSFFKGERGRGGFTLIELLVVIGILMVLMAILLPKILSGNDKKDAAAITKQVEDIEGGLDQYKGDIGSYPTAIEWLWSKTAVPAASQSYWRGPYLDTPMQINGTDPNENVQDNTVAGVVYTFVYVTSSSGGSGSCATSSQITGNTGDSGVNVVHATAVPHDIAMMIQGQLGKKVCIASATGATTDLYFPYDETWN